MSLGFFFLLTGKMITQECALEGNIHQDLNNKAPLKVCYYTFILMSSVKSLEKRPT